MGLMSLNWLWIAIAIAVVFYFFDGILVQIPAGTELTRETCPMDRRLVVMPAEPSMAFRRQVVRMQMRRMRQSIQLVENHCRRPER
jgi:hypothetical protein